MSSKNPTVSIILPIYNAEKFLIDALKSIKAQTFTDYEIIAIDDGSIDDSYKIIKKYKAEFDKLIIQRNQQNKGNSFTLNRAIDLAKGKFIMRMDADDLIDNRKIEKQVSFLQKNPDINVVGCGYRRISVNGKFILNRMVPTTHDKILKLLDLRKFFLAGPNFEITDGTIMGRSEWFKKYKYDENIYFAQDFDLICRSLSSSKFANLPDILYSYRSSSGVTANIKAQVIASRIKWNSIKKIQGVKINIFTKGAILFSLLLRPFIYTMIFVFHKLKNL